MRYVKKWYSEEVSEAIDYVIHYESSQPNTDKWLLSADAHDTFLHMENSVVLAQTPVLSERTAPLPLAVQQQELA